MWTNSICVAFWEMDHNTLPLVNNRCYLNTWRTFEISVLKIQRHNPSLEKRLGKIVFSSIRQMMLPPNKRNQIDRLSCINIRFFKSLTALVRLQTRSYIVDLALCPFGNGVCKPVGKRKYSYQEVRYKERKKEENILNRTIFKNTILTHNKHTEWNNNIFRK